MTGPLGKNSPELRVLPTLRPVKSFAYLRRVLGLTKPYRVRLALGIACGFLAGLTNPMLMVSVKLVVDTVFPTPGTPTLAEQVQAMASSRLAGPDVKAAPALLAQLRAGTNEFSRFLWSQIPAERQQWFTLTNITATQSRDGLAFSLDTALTNGAFYQPERFSAIALPSEARRLIAQNPQGDDLARLNRLLLHAAYPKAIAKPKSAFTRAIVQRVVPVLKRIDPHSSRLFTLLIICSIPLAMFLRGLTTYLNIYLMTWVSIRAIMDLRERLFGHLLSLSAAFFNRMSTGELMSRFTEVQMLQGTISNSLVVIIRDPITVCSLLAYLVSQQPRLTLIAVIVFPVTLIPFIVYSRKVRKTSSAMYAQYADMGKLLHETFTGYRVVKAYNLEKKMVEEFRSTSRMTIGFFMRMLRSSELPGPMIEFFGALGVTAFFIYLAFYNPDRTPGDLLTFIGSVFLMYAPIKNILKLHAQLEQANAASAFLFDLLETKTTVPEPAQPKPLKAAGVPIHFDNVHFAYGEKPVLSDFTLTVKPGQLVALVGSSGAGKTTVTSLLLRFYDPTQGVIRIGDTDIRGVSTLDLRSQVAVVTQEIILFNDTIRANVALGRPGATDAEIEAAVRGAHAWDFVADKPQGLDTIVGEKGVNLSGGQRQRLAIARAILKQAPILVLDEATNALDTESERAVQAALDEFMQGRTTICIAHRLSTIHHADVIVVMDSGRIVETGTHTELIQRGGTYQKLYEMQFRK